VEKLENQRLGKKCTELSIADKSIAIWRKQENIINIEISRCLSFGVDVIGWLLHTYTIFRSTFLLRKLFLGIQFGI